jgi:hypothetical protein
MVQSGRSTSTRRRRLLTLLVATAALSLSAASAQAAIVMVNPGFESGTTAGWVGSGTVTTQLNGYTAPYGSRFAYVTSGCPTNTLSQTFTASAGDKLSGAAFFDTDDYLPYNDNGSVRIVITPSGSSTAVFSSSVGQVGSGGGTPWTAWQYTFSSSGTYRIEVQSTNVNDCGVNSYVGIDIAQVVDADGDGVPDSSDNCPAVANAGQANNDGDGQGDACDADDDNDGVGDGGDNCHFTSNPGQANNDGDAQGDACDADDDDDSVNDGSDNCQFVSNTDQANNDGDAQGDLCDSDDDNDTVEDGSDNCQFVSNTDQANNDGDAQGDLCDSDDDNDTVEDGGDNCQFVSNTDQANNEGDAQGDACDANDDNDTVVDEIDNCQFTSNEDQANNDADAQGDACDADDDNDGLNDDGDNCQFVANPGQRDDDQDGIGDACDGQFDSNAGKSSGGGWLSSSNGKVNFSASAKNEDGTLSGNCVFTAGKTKIKCVTVDGYFQSPTSDRAVFVGQATHDGVATRYRIELTDEGEPGTSDRIEISTDSGFTAGGVIGAGNLQVHRGL